MLLILLKSFFFILYCNLFRITIFFYNDCSYILFVLKYQCFIHKAFTNIIIFEMHFYKCRNINIDSICKVNWIVFNCLSRLFFFIFFKANQFLRIFLRKTKLEFSEMKCILKYVILDNNFHL